MGLPSGGSDNSPANARDVRNTGLIPGFETIPWGREWQPTPVLLPGESPWTEEPGGLQLIGSQRVRHNRSNLAWHGMAHNCIIIYYYYFTVSCSQNFETTALDH